jgi:hypothetical protein
MSGTSCSYLPYIRLDELSGDDEVGYICGRSSIAFRKGVIMQSAEDFRFTSHQLLLALDASTIQMMKLVAISGMGSTQWHDVVRLHHASYAALHLHLEHPDAATLMTPRRQ